MALGNSNIGISSIQGESGFTSNKISVLSSDSLIQKYSFYAPGSLSVDVDKNAVLTSRIDRYKFGEFRSYYQSPQPPRPVTPFTLNWGPGGSSIDFQMIWYPEQMNIWEFSVPGDHVTQKYYLSAADRTDEVNAHKTQFNTITFGTITPLPGHSRNTTKRATSTQITQTLGFPTGGLSTPDDNVYVDTYISDLAGNRKINLGADISSGYTDMSFHELQQPILQADNGNMPPPLDHTTAFVEIFTSNTLCNSDIDIPMAFGSSNVSFYMHVRGIKGLGSTIVGYTSAVVNLYLNNNVYELYSGALSHSSNLSISYTLPVTWGYDDIGIVKVENETLSEVTTPC